MGDLNVNLLLLEEKNMFKSHKKIRPQSPMENLVDTYGTPVFAPDYSATGLASKM